MIDDSRIYNGSNRQGGTTPCLPAPENGRKGEEGMEKTNQQGNVSFHQGLHSSSYIPDAKDIEHR